MKPTKVSEVGIDPEGRLYVVPHGDRFDFVYRAGMEISWDKNALRLFAPNRPEWSYPRWFAQIQAAIANEYGCRFETSATTTWTNIPDNVKNEMQGLL